MMAINLRAPFILMQEAVAAMKPRGGGSIVNIGSVNAYIGEPKLCPYSVSKGGLMTLTRNAAASLSRYRIRVNQLNVGWTLTEGEERVKRVDEGLGAELAGATPSPRVPSAGCCSPQDIAYAAAYFASRRERAASPAACWTSSSSRSARRDVVTFGCGYRPDCRPTRLGPWLSLKPISQ